MDNQDRTKEQLIESLKESESRLKGILSSLVDLVFALDKRGRFIFYHAPQAMDLYVPPEEFIGKSHLEVLPPHLNDLIVEGLKKNKEGETTEFEYWLEIHNSIRWFIAKLSPLFLDSKFAGSVAVVREIKERKQTQKELKKYREHLEDLVKKRTNKIKITNEQLLLEVNARKRVELALKKSESNLRKQKSALEQKNIALGEIIAQIEVEKRRIRDDFLTNANIVLFPILEKFITGKPTQKDLHLFQYHLKGLSSSYGTKIIDRDLWLTPKEIEICNLVKAGFTNKDISRFLGISRQTAEGHRKRIRRKLGIANKNVNLTSYLREL